MLREWCCENKLGCDPIPGPQPQTSRNFTDVPGKSSTLFVLAAAEEASGIAALADGARHCR
ncbi:MAG: hypothetical protein EBZ13_13145 [Planctomycetia bacterium]|nr:hypothetical protein [Planctomycetia bacterium]